MGMDDVTNYKKNMVVKKQQAYSIVKSNDLIQKSRFQLTAQEQKIIIYLVSKIMPGDDELKVYDLSVVEFCKVCEMDYESGANYSHIKQTLKNLRDKSVWVMDEHGDEHLYSWIDKVVVSRRGGNVKIRLSDTMKPYLLQLKKNFTRYSLFYVLAMHSQYSIRMYEILKSYEFKGVCNFDLSELRVKLGAEKYTKHHDFMRRVVDTAMKEINGSTDIEVSYTLEKIGRRYSGIVLKIKTIEDYSKQIKANDSASEKLTKKKLGRPRKKAEPE